MCTSSFWETKLSIDKIGLCEKNAINTIIISFIAVILGIVIECIGVYKFNIKMKYYTYNQGSISKMIRWKFLINIFVIFRILLITSGNWIVILGTLAGKLIGSTIGWYCIQNNKPNRLFSPIKQQQKQQEQLNFRLN